MTFDLDSSKLFVADFELGLILRLRRLARERDWSAIRWITQEDNYRARGRYDQHAQRTRWVTYDMAPSPD